MAKYRKTATVEAHQITQHNLQDIANWPQWLTEAWEIGFDDARHDEPGAFYLNGDGKMTVRTLEGPLQLDIDDYIIRGLQGELYPCKRDIFEATYELFDDPAPWVPPERY